MCFICSCNIHRELCHSFSWYSNVRSRDQAVLCLHAHLERGSPLPRATFSEWSPTSRWRLCKDNELMSTASRQRILEKDSFRVLDSSGKKQKNKNNNKKTHTRIRRGSIRLLFEIIQYLFYVFGVSIISDYFAGEIVPSSTIITHWAFISELARGQTTFCMNVFRDFFSSSSAWNYSTQLNQRKKNQWMFFSPNHREN